MLVALGGAGGVVLCAAVSIRPDRNSVQRIDLWILYQSVAYFPLLRLVSIRIFPGISGVNAFAHPTARFPSECTPVHLPAGAKKNPGQASLPGGSMLACPAGVIRCRADGRSRQTTQGS